MKAPYQGRELDLTSAGNMVVKLRNIPKAFTFHLFPNLPTFQVISAYMHAYMHAISCIVYNTGPQGSIASLNLAT